MSTQRHSNIELLRITAMLLIVAHHYVANSGLFELIEQKPPSFNSYFLAIFGMWGKTAINCFVLITGYFMCKSQITIRKFLKLLLEIEFYGILIYLILVISRYIPFNGRELIMMANPFPNINSGFVSAFLLYYLFIPFINVLIRNLSQKQHLILIVLCLVIYSGFARMKEGIYVNYNYLTWFIILHFIASYIRFYDLFPNKGARFWGYLSILFIFISVGTLPITFKFHLFPYAFVQDSNAPLALINAICWFMFFKSLKINNSRFINEIAAGTFGVLLIHAHSNAMRNWLWRDTLANATYFDSPYLWIHAILSVVIVFAVCNVLDFIRRKVLEKPVLHYIDHLFLNKPNNA